MYPHAFHCFFADSADVKELPYTGQSEGIRVFEMYSVKTHFLITIHSEQKHEQWKFTLQDVYFQRDGKTAHRAEISMSVLSEMFPD